MLRYFFDVSYDGTNYHGWQIQINAQSVQGIIQEHLSQKLGSDIEIFGSGRTDTGVHAKHQVFHADLNQPINVQEFKEEMNRYLPTDISFLSIYEVNGEAHARFDAERRSYEYTISAIKNPFNYTYTYYHHFPLNIELLREGSKYLLGVQNFKSFSKVKTDVKNFDCEIFEANWDTTDSLLVFSISANRFLRGMVRAIVGTLIDVGSGKKEPAHILDVIEKKNRKYAGHAVPTKGLCLVEVKYPGHIIKE